MSIDEFIKELESKAEREKERAFYDAVKWNCITAYGEYCRKLESEYRQLAEWLKELRVFKSRKGQWMRMSDLPEQEDDRYKCSYCGNVIHRKNKIDLYTFNNWCGRCGSCNGKDIMAIKALEPSDEICVSRQAVNNLVDELARAISDDKCCTSRGRSTATILRDILQLLEDKRNE